MWGEPSIMIIVVAQAISCQVIIIRNPTLRKKVDIFSWKMNNIIIYFMNMYFSLLFILLRIDKIKKKYLNILCVR